MQTSRVLLPYEFTLLQNLKRGLKLLPVHVSQDFQLHLIISPPFCRKHIDYHIYARLFNYPAILHLFKCLNRHLKLLPAQNARNYTTPKPNLVLVFAFLGFIALWIYTTPKPNDINKYSPLGFTALWIYTTPKPQKRIFEAATSAKVTQIHYSKTNVDNAVYHMLFYYPVNLHYSKTKEWSDSNSMSFTTLWIYTTPKLIMIVISVN